MEADAPDVPNELDEWVEHTTAFDRVHSVAVTTDQPQTAPEIADEACVSPNTARDHLDRLAELRIVVDVGDDTSQYRANSLYQRFRMLNDLLREHDHDQLVEMRANLLDRLETVEEEYGTTEPSELRERSASSDSAAEVRDLMKTASEIETMQYRLHVIGDAIEQYDDYNRYIN